MQKGCFPGSEEEGFVFPEGAANSASKIVKVHCWGEKGAPLGVSALEGIARAEVGIAIEFINIPMKVVRARL